jgi:hypothetical protein
VPTRNSSGTNIANQTAYRLNCANGISDTNCPSTATGTSYLPPHPTYAPPYSTLTTHPPSSYAADWNLNYEPTILPQAAGGYAWVMFTTRRVYGNMATVNPFWSDPRFEDLSAYPTPKKLWVAAIDLNATPGTDPSHPAFYLDGQELLAGNSRGYWVLDACKPVGSTSASLCTSDLDCCSGEVCTLDTPLPTPATSHCATAPSTACVATGSPCVAGQICCDTTAICSQQTSTCVVPPPLPYYQEADFTRDYADPCNSAVTGKKVVWHAWQYETVTPNGSSIEFVVETTNNPADLNYTLDAGGPAYDGQPVYLPTTITGASITSFTDPRASQDVQSALLGAGQTSAKYLRVTVRLIPSPDGYTAPSLLKWNQQFDCVDAQ